MLTDKSATTMRRANAPDKSLSGLLAVLLLCVGCAATPGKISQSKTIPALYTVKGLALEGYDAVAYFTDGIPTRGNSAHQIEWQGIQWRFSKPENAVAFAANPDRYAPQYGGYCAFAVSRGTTASGDPHQWAVVDGKLYVNNNAFAMHLWEQDRTENISAADVNWPLLPKKSRFVE